jgi:hypothetical protein
MEVDSISTYARAASRLDMKSKLLALIACIALVGPAKAATIVYNIDISEGADTITGTITTNGTLGALVTADISAYSLSVTNSEATFPLSNTIGGTLDIQNANDDLNATATALTFNFSDTLDSTYLYIDGTGAAGSGSLGLYDEAYVVSPASGLIQIIPYSDTGTNVYVTGTVTLGSVSASATPLPAAFPLFGAGLGVIALLGRRRKRKDASAALAAA